MSEQASRVKSWKSMSEQLSLLRKRGLQVDNETAALDYLSRIGYYRLSGYWYPLREPIQNQSLRQKLPARTDQFIPGSHFEDVANLYIFDKKLRLLALDALERIEMAIRVDIAHLLGLWNINIVELTDIPKGWPDMKDSKPFMYFAMMVHLLDVICPNSTWTERLMELLKDFPKSRNSVLNISDFGTCQNWQQWLMGLKRREPTRT